MGKGEQRVGSPLGSSACLASLRRAAANPECADWDAGLPLATIAPLMGEGVRGLTVAMVHGAAEIIPNDGDFGSWLIPARENCSSVRPNFKSFIKLKPRYREP